MMVWADGDKLTPQNLNSKIPGNWSINVRDSTYGAGGIGGDDTAAVQAAIDAATLVGVSNTVPATVFMPAGRYGITRPLVVKEKVRLMGVGPRGTTIMALSGFTGTAMISTNTLGLLTGNPQQHAFVEMLEVLGNNVAGTNGILYDSVGQISYIRDVEVNFVNGYGIKLSGSSALYSNVGVTAENIQVSDTSDHCFIIDGETAGVTLFALTGQNHPAGKAVLYIDGTGVNNICGMHLVQGVHHESTDHGGTYYVYMKNTSDNLIQQVFSLANSSTDTAVYLDAGTTRNTFINVRPGGTNGNRPGIQDTVSGITISNDLIPLYIQPDVPGSAQSSSAAYVQDLVVARTASTQTLSVGTASATKKLHVFGGSSGVSVSARIEHTGANSGAAGLQLAASGSGAKTYHIVSADNTYVGSEYSRGGLYFENNDGVGSVFFDHNASALRTTLSQLLPPAGTALLPTYAFSSETSLGFYRSAASTIAPSYGTVNFAAAHLSVRTTNSSLNSTNVGLGELAFFVDSTSGFSIGVRSGSTIYFIGSSSSTKG